MQAAALHMQLQPPRIDLAPAAAAAAAGDAMTHNEAARQLYNQQLAEAALITDSAAITEGARHALYISSSSSSPRIASLQWRAPGLLAARSLPFPPGWPAPRRRADRACLAPPRLQRTRPTVSKWRWRATRPCAWPGGARRRPVPCTASCSCSPPACWRRWGAGVPGAAAAGGTLPRRRAAAGRLTWRRQGLARVVPPSGQRPAVAPSSDRSLVPIPACRRPRAPSPTTGAGRPVAGGCGAAARQLAAGCPAASRPGGLPRRPAGAHAELQPGRPAAGGSHGGRAGRPGSCPAASADGAGRPQQRP